MDTFLKRMGLKEGQAIIHPWINAAIERAQKKVEAQHFEIRKNLLKYDNVMNDQRRVIYEQRREIMSTDDVSETIVEMRHEVIENTISYAIPEGSYHEEWDIEGMSNEITRVLGVQLPVAEWLKEDGIDTAHMIERVKSAIDNRLAEKEAAVPADIMRQVEKGVLLQMLDQTWKEHLLNLDYLRQGIMLRAFGQKDPLNEYRTEAFEMFEAMLDVLREKVTNTICLIELHADESLAAMPQPKAPQKTNLFHGDEAPSNLTMLRPYIAPVPALICTLTLYGMSLQFHPKSPAAPLLVLSSYISSVPAALSYIP